VTYFLFAIYLDDIPVLRSLLPRLSLFVVVYADDILLIAHSVSELEELFDACVIELSWLDMNIKWKKSCCIHIGPRWDVRCRSIKTSNGHIIPWVTEFRYLGTYIVGGRTSKCSTSLPPMPNDPFTERSILFWKNWQASIRGGDPWAGKNKCIPCLLYGLECYTLPKSSLRSLDFVVVRFIMKLFKTVNNEFIRECCSYFKFPLPSELLDKRRDKFQSNFMLCTGILHYFGIKT